MKNVTELLEDKRIRGLSPTAFKAYCVLLEKSGSDKKIINFSIRGQAKEWQSDLSLNLISSKNTMKRILKELQDNKLIKTEKNKKTLRIL